MLLPFLALLFGLALLVWSADRFVESASALAMHLRISPLVIGMVIIGFGTSAPELIVSTMAALNNNPGLALGNAYGSNIANIGMVIGLASLLAPMKIASGVVKKDLPVLLGISLLSGFQLLDGSLSRLDGVVLIIVFLGIMTWTIMQARSKSDDELKAEIESEIGSDLMSTSRGIFWLIIGLIVLIVSSRLLVWGAVDIAVMFGVSEVIIGLTIVAVGTSLPELAAALAAVRKGEHDMVIGNILGSAVFNTLAVVGIAVVIRPFDVESVLLLRDWPTMMIFTVLLLVACSRWGKPSARISRLEGGGFVAAYVIYVGYLASIVLG